MERGLFHAFRPGKVIALPKPPCKPAEKRLHPKKIKQLAIMVKTGPLF
jgi:hypothetical protein